MTKKILLSTVVAASLATSAFAGGNAAGTTSARLNSLGLGNTQVVDQSNIWANPANINSNTDSVLVDSNTFGGVTYDAGFGNFGLYFSRDGLNTVSKSASFTLDPAITATPAPTNQMDLFYGMGMKSMDLGLRVSYASSHNGQTTFTDTITTTNNTAQSGSVSDLEIELGVNLKGTNIDVALSYGMPSASESFTSTPATTNTYGTTSASVLSATVGHNLDMNKGKNLRSVIYYGSSSINTQASDGAATPLTETNAFSNLLISASTTLSKKHDEKTTTYYSLGVVSSSNTTTFTNSAATPTVTTTKNSALNVPAVMAIETKTTENWTARASASLNVFNMGDGSTNTTIGTTVNQTTAATSNASNAVAFGLGAGYKNKAITIDADINANGAGLLARVTAGYAF